MLVEQEVIGVTFRNIHVDFLCFAVDKLFRDAGIQPTGNVRYDDIVRSLLTPLNNWFSDVTLIPVLSNCHHFRLQFILLNLKLLHICNLCRYSLGQVHKLQLMFIIFCFDITHFFKRKNEITDLFHHRNHCQILTIIQLTLLHANEWSQFFWSFVKSRYLLKWLV